MPQRLEPQLGPITAVSRHLMIGSRTLQDKTGDAVISVTVSRDLTARSVSGHGSCFPRKERGSPVTENSATPIN